MKNTSKILAGLALVIVAGCQQVQPVSDQPFTPDPPAGNDITLCSDGTLNCYVTIPPTTTTFTGMNFNENYDTCMNTCLAAGSCVGYADLNAAASQCPTTFSSCEAQCNLTSEGGTLGNLPGSDGLTLPERPKAVLVEIEGCYNMGTYTEIHFQGVSTHFNTPKEGTRSVLSSGGFLGIGSSKKVNLGYDVGANPKCGSSLKNKVRVKFSPVGESTVTLGSHTVTVVPFTDTSVIEKNYSLPKSVSFGIPAAIRESVDLSEIVWFPKAFGEASPSSIHSINDWRYYNNDIPYGDTVVFAGFYGFSAIANQKISMYVFIKSKD